MSGPEELPRPIGEVLGGDPDDAQVARMWAGIAARRASPRRRAAWWTAGGLLVAAAAVAAFVAWGSGSGPGPLAMRDGHAPRAWSVPADARMSRVELDDGSAIALAPGTRLEAVENAGDRFCVLLRSGRARFSVKPGGPRRWIVEAGLATVEVVGTVFDVTRSDEGVRVSVQRGVVVVRGERVPNRVQRLEAGESLSVPAAIAVVTPSAPSAPSSNVLAVGPLPSAPLPSVPAPGVLPTVQPPGVLPPGVLPTGPLAPPVAPAPPDYDAMLDDADTARREGRTADALALLDRVAASGDGPHAALASFTRAKLELAASPADAARDFERAIARGLPAPLDAEAHARLDAIRARAGAP